MVSREANKDMVGSICYPSLSEAEVQIFIRLDVYFAQKDIKVMRVKWSWRRGRIGKDSCLSVKFVSSPDKKEEVFDLIQVLFDVDSDLCEVRDENKDFFCMFSKQGTWLYLEICRGECPGRKFPFQNKFLFSETSCEKETSLIV